jgi:hypothetical protein
LLEQHVESSLTGLDRFGVPHRSPFKNNALSTEISSGTPFSQRRMIRDRVMVDRPYTSQEPAQRDEDSYLFSGVRGLD